MSSHEYKLRQAEQPLNILTSPSSLNFPMPFRPGNDWAQGTTDTWAGDFLGACQKFSVSSNDSEIEIDFLLSGRDDIQVRVWFSPRTQMKKKLFQKLSPML